MKCFEDNGFLYELLEENGSGRVLLVDGGGSVRRALIDAELGNLAVQNEWEGIVVYGAVRQVDNLEELDLGIQAMAATPPRQRRCRRRYWRKRYPGKFRRRHLLFRRSSLSDNTGVILSEDALDLE